MISRTNMFSSGKSFSIMKGEPNSPASGTIVLITGGARSGKSSYAQNQALAVSDNPIYVATAESYPSDEEFKQRIDRHKADRDQRWTSIEEPLYVSKLSLEQRVVVIDCITLWLTNFFS